MGFSYHSKEYTNRYEAERLALLSSRIDARCDPNGSVIEFGCNNGSITRILASRFGKVVAIDADSELLRKAERTIEATNTKWVLHDLNYPIEKVMHRQFDAAVAFEVIEHLDSPQKFLTEIALVLRPGGILMLSTPNVASPEGIVGTWRARKNGERFKAWDNSHKTLFTSAGLLKLLRQSGFRIERVAGYYFDVSMLPGLKSGLRIPVRSASMWPFNRFGFNILVEARYAPVMS